jgi:glyoxylase I family protein
MKQFLSLHHGSVLVADTAVVLEFYCGVLGLEQDQSRPDLGYPGAWLNIGESQIHLLELPNPDPIDNRPLHIGRDRHLACRVADLDGMITRLEKASVDYTRSRSGRSAIFCRDTDGNGLEIIE